MQWHRLALAASFALTSGTALAQDTVFPVSYWYAAVSGPNGCDLADVDLDGNPDLLVANYYTDKIQVFLGTGTGQFNEIQPLTCVGQPRTLAIGNLNADSLPDVVAVESSNNQVSVFLATAPGVFAAPVQFPAGDFPVAIDIGDLNGDGKADIVVGEQATSQIAALLGNGLGGFAAPLASFVGASPERIALADFDQNGTLDCVSASWLDGGLDVMLGTGNGGFTPGPSLSAPAPKGLAVGDMNADGRPDVAAASSQFDAVYVFLATPTGFAPPVVRGVGDYPTTLLLADANGDGRPDLITCEANAPGISVLVNVGGGEFDFAKTSPITEGAWDGVAADLDGDGLADVITSCTITNNLRVNMGAGTGTWEHYCTAKTNSAGCTPRIQGIGTPSVNNARPFLVRVDQVLNAKPGLFLYTVNGAQTAVPFQGGTLCLGGAPIRRTAGANSGGEVFPPVNCTGAYSLDFNAFAQGLLGGNPAPGLSVLGNSYQVQCWSRDPGFPAPNNTGLSPALDVTPWI